MKLISLGSKPEIKAAELSLNNGVKLLFSYGTLVAALIPGKGYVRLDEYVSKTTERHITEWVDSFFKCERVGASYLEDLLTGAKDAQASSQSPAARYLPTHP